MSDTINSMLHSADNNQHFSVQIIYKTYTPASKRAILKWRESNLEKWRETDRVRKANRLRNDTEYREKTRAQARMRYANKKLKTATNSAI